MRNRIEIPASVFVTICFLAIAAFGQTTASQEAPPPNNGPAAPNPAIAVSSNPPVAAPAPRAPRFVPVLISATDGSGSPISGLTKEQLTIQDNNRAVQPLQLYKDFPLHLGIVLLSTTATFSQQQAAAIDLVNRVIRPNVDQAFVVSARGTKPWPSERLDWLHDPTELATAIRGLDRNAGLPDPFNFSLNSDEAGLNRYTLQTFGQAGVSVFDIIDTMMSSDPRPSRRVVLMFREPWAHSPGFGNRANAAVEAQLLRVIAAAQQAHVATFVIGLEDPKFSRGTDATLGKNYVSAVSGEAGQTAEYDTQIQQAKTRGYDAGKTNIERLASDTGGETFWSTKKNYADAISAIANRLAGQYIVTFTPSEAPGAVHSLKINGGATAHILAQSAFFYEPAK